MRIKFLKTDTPFEKGEEYTFPEKEAKKFIRHGVAESCGRSAASANEDYVELETNPKTSKAKKAASRK